MKTPFTEIPLAEANSLSPLVYHYHYNYNWEGATVWCISIGNLQSRNTYLVALFANVVSLVLLLALRED